jgi:hypothetical protein
MAQSELKDHQKRMLAEIEPMINQYGNRRGTMIFSSARRSGKSQAARMVADTLAGTNPKIIIMDELTLISINEYETHPLFGRF